MQLKCVNMYTYCSMNTYEHYARLLNKLLLSYVKIDSSKTISGTHCIRKSLFSTGSASLGMRYVGLHDIA